MIHKDDGSRVFGPKDDTPGVTVGGANNHLKLSMLQKEDANDEAPLFNSIEVDSIILEAQKKKIKSAEDLNQVVKDVLKSNQKTILLVILNTQNQRRYIGIKLD